MHTLILDPVPWEEQYVVLLEKYYHVMFNMLLLVLVFYAW